MNNRRYYGEKGEPQKNAMVKANIRIDADLLRIVNCELRIVSGKNEWQKKSQPAETRAGSEKITYKEAVLTSEPAFAAR